MSLICPYNSSHKVGAKRFEIHKMTCPNRPNKHQPFIKPILSSNIQEIRAAYLKDCGGIQPEIIKPFEYSNQQKKNKKRKRRDIVGQLNDLQLPNENSSDNKEFESISCSGFEINNEILSNPISGDSQIDLKGYLLSNEENDYDPNKEDIYIDKYNKNWIDGEFISRIRNKDNNEELEYK